MARLLLVFPLLIVLVQSFLSPYPLSRRVWSQKLEAPGQQHQQQSSASKYGKEQHVDLNRDRYNLRRYRLHSSLSKGDELDNQMALALSVRSSYVFDLVSSGELLTKEFLDKWELEINSAAAELRQLSNKSVLIKVYMSLLSKVSTQVLDPLQVATFEIMVNAIVDSLIRLAPKNEPITGLIDEITDNILDSIEGFQKRIDDGGDEG
jgi:hypothetical protein